MKAKDRHRQKLIEFLSNPENSYCTRTDMATKVLGFSDQSTLYQTFSPKELHEIEGKALDLRREKYSPYLARVDKGVIERAAAGDPQAAKLAYQRFEGWSEKNVIHIKYEDALKELLNLLPPELREKLIEKLTEKAKRGTKHANEQKTYRKAKSVCG